MTFINWNAVIVTTLNAGMGSAVVDYPMYYSDSE